MYRFKTWSSRKSEVQADFCPAPINNFYCVSIQFKKNLISIEKVDFEIFDMLCNLNPQSAIALHKKRRSTSQRYSAAKNYF